ncbi:MAG: haloacid dehalogenase [Chloroflexi bacterium RBG_16_47_49]|nr:MAG: haloacid dehalogenase [Chloroflexi bacterium RBG_16_47_49]
MPRKLEEIAEKIHHSFEICTSERDRALTQARTLTRHCANAIRAIHRDEQELARQHLGEARQLVQSLRENLKDLPELFYAGYTQDALKEFGEAALTYALIDNHDFPSPDDLNLEAATYLQGLAEAVGELRRRCLDMLLKDKPADAERLMGEMDDIYAILVTMDYPDAITGGLRRLTDVARGIIERTRGDLTLSLRQGRLENSLRELETHLDEYNQSE